MSKTQREYEVSKDGEDTILKIDGKEVIRAPSASQILQVSLDLKALEAENDSSMKNDRIAELESRLAEAEKKAKLFCEEQCEEGVGWGECEESGCQLFFIKKAIRGEAEGNHNEKKH